MEIKRYTKTEIDDVIQFELQLRREEDFWGWEIDDAYIESVKRSFKECQTSGCGAGVVS